MPQATDFFSISKEIANRYLQSIIFVDERAYEQEAPEAGNNHYFPTKRVSAAFSKNQKICSIIAPTSVREFDEYSNSLFKKSDVLVLDWYLKFDEEVVVNEEEDADDNIEGKHTLRCLKGIAEDAGTEKLRLILIYTSRDQLERISGEILSALSIFDYKKSGYCIESPSKNVKILIRIKDDDNEHQGEMAEYKLSPEQLPSFILDEFTLMTMGLIPNYALSCISQIRENSSKILWVMSKDLDAPFMCHKLSIPNKDDANELITECFASLLECLLSNNSNIINDWEEPWANAIINAHRNVELVTGCEIDIDVDFVKKVLLSKKDTLRKRLNEALPIGKKIKDENELEAPDNIIKLFIDDADYARGVKDKFATFVQRRNLVKTLDNVPMLTLGSVVKDENTNKYFLCIQQSCDSIRVKQPRKFLFLPLSEKVNGKEQPCIIVDSGLHLFVDLKSYNLTQYVLKPDEESKTIRAVQDGNNQYVFEVINQQYLRWICDIKKTLALRIVNQYTSQLSRVGVDQPEWVRLSELT